MEGYTAARQQAMIDRNDAFVAHLQDSFQARVKNQNFFTTVVFESAQQAALSWAISKADRRRLCQRTRLLKQPPGARESEDHNGGQARTTPIGKEPIAKEPGLWKVAWTSRGTDEKDHARTRSLTLCLSCLGVSYLGIRETIVRDACFAAWPYNAHLAEVNPTGTF